MHACERKERKKRKCRWRRSDLRTDAVQRVGVQGDTQVLKLEHWQMRDPKARETDPVWNNSPP